MDAIGFLILGGAAIGLARILHALRHTEDTKRLARLWRETQREEWRRVARGEGLPEKVKAYLEGL